MSEGQSCGKCQHGIVGWKADFNKLPGPLWEVRCALLDQNLINFCPCQVGAKQRSYLQRTYEVHFQKEKDWFARLKRVLEVTEYDTAA